MDPAVVELDVLPPRRHRPDLRSSVKTKMPLPALVDVTADSREPAVSQYGSEQRPEFVREPTEIECQIVISGIGIRVRRCTWKEKQQDRTLCRTLAPTIGGATVQFYHNQIRAS